MSSAPKCSILLLVHHKSVTAAVLFAGAAKGSSRHARAGPDVLHFHRLVSGFVNFMAFGGQRKHFLKPHARVDLELHLATRVAGRFNSGCTCI